MIMIIVYVVTCRTTPLNCYVLFPRPCLQRRNQRDVRAHRRTHAWKAKRQPDYSYIIIIIIIITMAINNNTIIIIIIITITTTSIVIITITTVTTSMTHAVPGQHRFSSISTGWAPCRRTRAADIQLVRHPNT